MHISPTSLAYSINLIYLPDTASSTHISGVMNTHSTPSTQNTATDNQSVNQKKESSCCKRFWAFFKCGKKKTGTSDSPTLERLKTQLLSKENDFKNEGIFRQCVQSSDITNAQKNIDKHLMKTNQDIYLQCNLFKAYFKDSLTKENAEQIQRIITQTTPLTRDFCNTFPPNFNCLLSLLPVIKKYENQNKMTEENLARIFAPHLSEHLVESDIAPQSDLERIKNEMDMAKELMSKLGAFFVKYNAFIENPPS